jgi:hypothetical protein
VELVQLAAMQRGQLQVRAVLALHLQLLGHP